MKLVNHKDTKMYNRNKTLGVFEMLWQQQL